MRDKKIKAIVSSGNVFADLGFENPEEELLKARLASLVNRAIVDRDLTQKEVATLLGIKQSMFQNWPMEDWLAFL